MQNLSYSIILLLICSSCALHQYATVESTADQVTDGTYVFENDSFRIKYSFKGDQCPLNISIFNKLSVPLYVDWRKSSVIIRQQRFPLWIDQAEINAYTQGTTVTWTQWANTVQTPTTSTTSSVTTGTITRPESSSFIPPDSYIAMTPVKLRQEDFQLDRKNASRTRINSSGSVQANGYAYEFEKEDSPLAFKSFLVLSTDERSVSPQYISHDFWVSDIMETGITPNTYPLSENQFITRKKASYRTAAVVLVSATGVVAIMAVLATDKTLDEP